MLDKVLSPTRFRLLIFLLAVVGTAAIFFATDRFGIGLSPDSIIYISTARNISSGRGAITYTGDPILLWPPLYPAILAAIQLILGLDPLISARAVSAVCLGSTIYLSGLLFSRYATSSRALALLGTICVLLSIPLVYVSLMAWSEPLFIVLILFFMVLFDSYQAKRDTASLMLMAGTLALACLTRYVGVSFVAAGLISLLLLPNTPGLRAKLSHLLIFALVSTIPLGLWMIRNDLVSGTLAGPRGSSVETVAQSISFAATTLATWFAPSSGAGSTAAGIILGVILVVVAALRLRVVWVERRIRFQRIDLCLVIPAVYLGSIFVSSTIFTFNGIDTRLSAPIAVPALLALFWAAEQITQALAKYSQPATLLAAVGISVWLVAYPLSAVTESLKQSSQQGNLFSSPTWRDSATISWLRQSPVLDSGCTLYSNAPDVIYLFTDRTSEPSPMSTLYDAPDIINDLAHLKGEWPSGDQNCLVWFDNIDWRGYLFTVDQLRTIANLSLVARVDDGTIYTVTRK